MPDQDVTIQSSARERRRPEPEPVELTVLYEDAAIVALDKPAGMVVHPTYKNTSGTLLNGVLWRYRDRRDIQPGILTRLDKETSGVVVVALTPALHARLQRDAATGRVTKEYLAIVRGAPDPARGIITLPLARDAQDRRRVVVTESGAACETRYEVVRRVDRCDWSVVRCELITGRTHQIRVHLSALGCPVVGDATYGEAHEAIPRQALHAWRVSLLHPVTRDRLSIEAPLPRDFRDLMTP
ncbi:MAG TPA: RluA family pseudouridine synthase [Vicinamibacterales bacterium]